MSLIAASTHNTGLIPTRGSIIKNFTLTMQTQSDTLRRTFGLLEYGHVYVGRNNYLSSSAVSLPSSKFSTRATGLKTPAVRAEGSGDSASKFSSKYVLSDSNVSESSSLSRMRLSKAVNKNMLIKMKIILRKKTAANSLALSFLKFYLLMSSENLECQNLIIILIHTCIVRSTFKNKCHNL